MEIVSNQGTTTNATLVEGTNATLRMFLTDLPQPSSFNLYANGTLVEESAWNSGIAYEYNIPLKTTAVDDYSFHAEIYFAGTGDAPVTTNTAVLKVIATPSSSLLSSTSNSTLSPDLVSSSSSSTVPTLTLGQKIGIGIGIATAIGVASYFVIHPKGLQQFMNRH